LPSAAMACRRAPRLCEGDSCKISSPDSPASTVCASTSCSSCSSSDSGKVSHSSAQCLLPLPKRVLHDLDCRCLGHGGTSTVWAGHCHGHDGLCAMKSISKDDFGVPQQAYHEAKVLRSIEHPGVCKLLDMYEDSDNICLVLEYIEGHELFDELGGDILPNESRISEIMRQLLTTLEFCHGPQHSIVHRDIKPENIMIMEVPSMSKAIKGPALQVKLIDFGLATPIGQELDGIAGTRPYMAPETLSETGFCCSSLDMWSLGVVLYACLLGELPPAGVRAGCSPLDLADAIWDKHGVSLPARNLVAGLLQVDPGQRLSAAQALQHPWIQCAGSISEAHLPVP